MVGDTEQLHTCGCLQCHFKSLWQFWEFLVSCIYKWASGTPQHSLPDCNPVSNEGVVISALHSGTLGMSMVLGHLQYISKVITVNYFIRAREIVQWLSLLSCTYVWSPTPCLVPWVPQGISPEYHRCGPKEINKVNYFQTASVGILKIGFKHRGKSWDLREDKSQWSWTSCQSRTSSQALCYNLLWWVMGVGSLGTEAAGHVHFCVIKTF